MPPALPAPAPAGRKAFSTEDPGVAHRLQNRIRIRSSESRPASNSTRASAKPPANKDDDELSLPEVNMKELLNILQMKGERPAEPKRRRLPLIQQLKFSPNDRKRGSVRRETDLPSRSYGFTDP